MYSFMGQRYTILSFLSLISLAFLSLYLRHDDVSQINSHLNKRQLVSIAKNAISNSSSLEVSLAGPPAGFAHITAYDPYTCGPGRPCSNGACCGPSGNCGYSAAYCGPGCLSNCDAKAQCGQYAKTPGTTCPLNACCSEHGFCGTTKVGDIYLIDSS